MKDTKQISLTLKTSILAEIDAAVERRNHGDTDGLSQTSRLQLMVAASLDDARSDAPEEAKP